MLYLLGLTDQGYHRMCPDGTGFLQTSLGLPTDFFWLLLSLEQLCGVTHTVVCILYPQILTICSYSTSVYLWPYQKIHHEGAWPKFAIHTGECFSHTYVFPPMVSIRLIINTTFRWGCLISSVILRIPVLNSNHPHAELINCSYLRLHMVVVGIELLIRRNSCPLAQNTVFQNVCIYFWLTQSNNDSQLNNVVVGWNKIAYLTDKKKPNFLCNF